MISPSVNIQIVQKFLLFGQMICEYFLCCQTSQITRLHDHPHCGVRTAPALIGRKQPHHHNFRTFFEHYFSIFRQVYLVVQYIFLQSKKKNIFEPYFSIFEEEYTTQYYAFFYKASKQRKVFSKIKQVNNNLIPYPRR